MQLTGSIYPWFTAYALLKSTLMELINSFIPYKSQTGKAPKCLVPYWLSIRLSLLYFKLTEAISFTEKCEKYNISLFDSTFVFGYIVNCFFIIHLNTFLTSQ
ncbi:Schizosaccharomyces pombe specific protein [Schizosaccharomyces pombe]|uniref:Uncharacterized membrane protein C27F1.10 n=1 Tax=Schizosaccharomyces pombe (strain 972 / ATCC 24843) TaxID=284812 RepID=YAVA_SCHPO|nr:uncharacterized protein SPAC27F1.10 [Schizosaccharomyces pombe]Q9C112.1 RecName: Full=Uncharacterized membrane protein C27F1.10; Flags: Precursor [Schizosaccharomyces pombe 972h-]CAC34963.1 sequence orphan [Schizosaccharomyces pombe]|eukprot:NP_594534.1 uncharacterized protein SPAC27F1.10 [Schizosaccharomyces pombe]